MIAAYCYLCHRQGKCEEASAAADELAHGDRRAFERLVNQMRYYAALELAAARGMVLTPGWPFLVPALLAEGLAHIGEIDAARYHFAVATDVTLRLGLNAEIDPLLGLGSALGFVDAPRATLAARAEKAIVRVQRRSAKPWHGGRRRSPCSFAGVN